MFQVQVLSTHMTAIEAIYVHTLAQAQAIVDVLLRMRLRSRVYNIL